MTNKKISADVIADEKIDMGILENNVGFILHRAETYSYRGFVKEMTNPKTTAKQFPILIVMELNPGISQTVLGGCLGMDRATTMAVLDSLQDKKLILRKKSTTDKRKHALFLSAKGKATVKKLKQYATEYDEKLTKHLTAKEIKQFKYMLNSVQLGAMND